MKTQLQEKRACKHCKLWKIDYFNSQILSEGRSADKAEERAHYCSLTTCCSNLCVPLGRPQKNPRQLHSWNWYNHCHMLDSYFLIRQCDSFQSKQAMVSSTVLTHCVALQLSKHWSQIPVTSLNAVLKLKGGERRRVAFKLHVGKEDVLVSLSALSIRGTRSY